MNLHDAAISAATQLDLAGIRGEDVSGLRPDRLTGRQALIAAKLFLDHATKVLESEAAENEEVEKLAYRLRGIDQIGGSWELTRDNDKEAYRRMARHVREFYAPKES